MTGYGASISDTPLRPSIAKPRHVKREASEERKTEGWCLCFSFATPVSPTPRNKRKRNAGRRCSTTPAPSGAALPLWGSSPVGVPPRLSPKGVFHPKGSASGQVSWDAARALDPQKPAPTGGRRPCAVQRALPALACPSPAKHLAPRSSCRGTDAQAARERSVWPRPRAPHSLHRRRVPSSGGVLTERDDSWYVTISGTNVNGSSLNQ
jgi:hypothetical protein